MGVERFERAPNKEELNFVAVDPQLKATKVKVFISRNTNQMMPFIYVQAQNTIKCPQQ